MMIRKMEKCRGCFLFSQQKGKTVRNKGHSDSHPMHRSADYGYVGDGYHQIHFPNQNLSILLRSMHCERQSLTQQ